MQKQGIQLISLSKNLIPQHLIPQQNSNKISFWENINISRLKKLRKPFFLFSTYDNIKNKKEEIAKLKNIKFFKGLVLSLESKIYTLYGAYLLEGFSKSLIDKIHPFVDEDAVRRIAHAWRVGAQNDLIADFSIDSQGEMYILGCDFKIYKCSYQKLESLKNMTMDNLQKFTIGPQGESIHWPSQDIHLDLYSFKAILDEKYKKQLLQKKLKHYQDLGQRLEVFRKNREMTQKQFNLCDRQIRRLENGEEFPSLKALQSIADSYCLDLEDLLEQLY